MGAMQRGGGRGAGISCTGVKYSDFLQSSHSVAKGKVASKPQSLKKVYEEQNCVSKAETIYAI